MTLLFDDGEQCRIHDHVVVAVPALPFEALLGRDFLALFDVASRRDGVVTLAR